MSMLVWLTLPFYDSKIIGRKSPIRTYTTSIWRPIVDRRDLWQQKTKSPWAIVWRS